MKILVADDDPVSCRLMQRMLEPNGYEVSVVSDGSGACEALTKSDGPKLALVDWMMPEMDGPAVCREVRRRVEGPYVYILLLTAKQTQRDVVAGLQAGADDYLTKPCHPAELNARLLTGKRILQLESRLVEARESMRYQATHDGLTALLNRTEILDRLNRSLYQAGGNLESISVMLCDIDNFKSINDRFGHLTGDQVLRSVAAIIQRVVGSRGWVGRYGGEEFLIVLRDCAKSDTLEQADRLRHLISTNTSSSNVNPGRVTASIGAVACDRHSHCSADEVIAAADEALYRAKQQGRNCARLGVLRGPRSPLLPYHPKHLETLGATLAAPSAI